MATDRGDREKLDPKGLEAALQAATDLPAGERTEALVAFVSGIITAYLAALAADLLDERRPLLPACPDCGEADESFVYRVRMGCYRCGNGWDVGIEELRRAALSPEPDSEG